ncbi:MAG TPA: MerR family transcriptional regulator [Streptosporangiaceae bacterium]|nr:MerR family transcriptional regulator [Streptosporangiaceae bacterium]
MRITEAAQALGTSPRMLRYRESLGLLPLGQQRRSRGDRAGRFRPGPGGAGRDGAGRDGARRDVARRESRRAGGPGAAHRQFTDADLAAAALGLSIERRYDISPAALAFGIRVLADPRVRSEVAELGRRIGRIQAPPARALDFEQERALRLLRMDQNRP